MDAVRTSWLRLVPAAELDATDSAIQHLRSLETRDHAVCDSQV